MNPMNTNIDKKTENEKGNYLEIGRTNDIHTNEITQVNYIDRTKQNSISVEQFDKAGQQISSIKGVSILKLDPINPNKLIKTNDEFNRNGQHHPSKPKDNHDKEFLSNYQVEEYEPDVFKILFDLDTREAGADYAIINNTRIKIVCEDYEINLKHSLNSKDLNLRIMYALRREEDNTRVIRQILEHIKYLSPIIDSIFSYFRKQGIEK
jgi:hypothetical protein